MIVAGATLDEILSDEAVTGGVAVEDTALPPAASRQVLRKKAMDLLARREHSVAELHRKLGSYANGKTRLGAKGVAKKQKPDPGLIDEVLDTLQNEGLVSDARFTEAFVRYRANNGYGPQHIQAELRERGVSEKIRAVHLDAGDPLWFERALQVRHKRFGEALPADLKERARQARFLQYRGFTTDQAWQVLGGDAID